MMTTRRTFLALTGLASGALTMAEAPARATPRDDLEERASHIIEEYDRQGIHRTGTDVDARSARWLAAELERCGLTAQLEEFTLNRVEPQVCRVVSGGRSIEGLPVFDGSFTGASGVSGRLGALGGTAEIGLIELPPNAEYSVDYEPLRRASRQRAIIVMTKGGRAGLCPINAGKFREPYGPPLLQVGSEHSEWLRRQSEAGAEAVVIAHVKRKETPALNVVATLKGGNAELAPLVLMTPRSGWWHATSERGGGLVCWLESLRALAASKPSRTVHCVASSGHELGHLGLQHFIERRPELVRAAHVWLHFGANIGARGAPNRIQTPDDDLEQLAVGAMQAAGLTVQDKAQRGTVPFGEAGNIHRLGGRYVSLLCPGSPFFHHPADRWPDTVDITAVARYARAFAGLSVKLTR